MWDARDSEVVRSFLIPRGSAIVAGGTVAADATKFNLEARIGSQTYGILANNWLDKNARPVSYEVTIDTSGTTSSRTRRRRWSSMPACPKRSSTRTATRCAGSPTPRGAL